MTAKTSWEAAFFDIYYRASNTNLANVISAANKITNSIATTVDLIFAENVSMQIKYSNLTIVSTYVISLGKSIKSGAYSHFIQFRRNYDYNSYEYRRLDDEYNDRVSAAAKMCFSLGDAILKHDKGDEMRKLVIVIWESGQGIFESSNYPSRIQELKDSFKTDEQLLKEAENALESEKSKLSALRAKGPEKPELVPTVMRIVVVGGILLIFGILGIYLLCSIELGGSAALWGILCLIIAGLILYFGIIKPHKVEVAELEAKHLEDVREQEKEVEKKKQAVEKIRNSHK